MCGCNVRIYRHDRQQSLIVTPSHSFNAFVYRYLRTSMFLQFRFYLKVQTVVLFNLTAPPLSHCPVHWSSCSLQLIDNTENLIMSLQLSNISTGYLFITNLFQLLLLVCNNHNTDIPFNVRYRAFSVYAP